MTSEAFCDAVARRARDMPDRIAFRSPSGVLRYADLDREANRIANALSRQGIRAGDRVACFTRHMPQCVLLIIAAQRVGAVCMPINWRLSPVEVEDIVHHGEVRFIMVDHEFLPSLRPMPAGLVKKTVCTLPNEKQESLSQWASASPDTPPPYTAGVHDTALQLYSSGTTGVPKGVELSHRNLVSMGEAARKALRFDERPAVTLNVAPTFHIGGLSSSFSNLLAGDTTVIFSEFDPPKVVAALAEHRITHAFFVPAMIHLLLQVPGIEATDFSALRAISYGSAPITESVLIEAMRVFACRFVQVYGLSETTGSIVSLCPEDHDPKGPRAHLLRAAGKPWGQTRLRIVDVGSGREVPEGQVGEIWVYSPQNMVGYWRNEAATREAFPKGRDAEGCGWLRTGDAGSLRDGYLFIEDRVKDMIISGGENIYPAEVENVLMKHPSVLDCAVIAVPNDKWGESVKACIVRKQGVLPAPQEIIAFCRERLAHYKCPQSIDWLDSLPRNPSGKVLKHVLRAPYWSGKTRKVN